MTSNERDPREERPNYHPASVQRAVRENNLRWRRVQDDPVFTLLRDSLGDEGFLELIWQGDKELMERQNMSRQMYTLLGRAESRVSELVKITQSRSQNESGHNDVPYFLANQQGSPYYRLAEKSDFGAAQAEQDLESHPVHAREHTLRRSAIVKAATIFDLRSQAMTLEERRRLDEDVDFFRDQSYRSEFPLMYYRSLLRHYRLESTDNTLIHLFSRGVQAPKHAMAWLFSYFPDANYMWFGTQYFESRKFPEKMRQMGYPVPGIGYIADPEPHIVGEIDSFSKNGKPTVIFADPIESFDLEQLRIDSVQNIMRPMDMSRLLTAAAERFTGDVPFFLVSDITNTGGVFQLFEKAKSIVGQSNVNIIGVQSLYKFFEYGWDITPLGAEIAVGPAFEHRGEGSLYERSITTLNLFNMGPGISEFALMPPLSETYLEFRAARVMRNINGMLEILQAQLGDYGVEFSYPSLREMDKEKTEFIGFLGPYFFMKMPTLQAAERFETLVGEQRQDHLGVIDYGSSFGYDATRVERFGDIIRVATGTEDILHMTFIGHRMGLLLKQSL